MLGSQHSSLTFARQYYYEVPNVSLTWVHFGMGIKSKIGVQNEVKIHWKEIRGFKRERGAEGVGERGEVKRKRKKSWGKEG